MGDHNVKETSSVEARARFIKHLLNDIKALEMMMDNHQIEDDVVRIGAEQEFCLVNDEWRPAKNSLEILNQINDPHFTTELARYNLEINLDPVELQSGCFTQAEQQLSTLLKKAKAAAEMQQTKVVLTGILPSITKSEMGFDFMTPSQRYWSLNDIIKEQRGGDFQLKLSGVDELSLTHDSVLFEACNTSFQLHLQIPPQDFISSYNWAQAIAGPVLGICTNSPLLLGRELWSETRIALFQQSIDTRNSGSALKDRQARVTIGEKWSSGSAVDIFKNDAALYKVFLAREIEEDSLATLKAGKIPSLKALCLHNSTIYRWNRACYGLGNGKPHLRIENRYIPSGPTVIDQMANFALWVGLMKGRTEVGDNIANHMDFRDAKANFIRAARTGRDSTQHWNGQQIPLPKLIQKEFLPMAYSGLKSAGIETNDAERLLNIIDARAQGFTGSKWIVKNYRNLRKDLKKDDARRALTKGIYEHQSTEKPVHEWPMLETDKSLRQDASRIAHIMSTRLYVVSENDLAELATSVMEWKGIHHVPVENADGDLCGLLTWTHMQRYKEQEAENEDLLVGDIMARDVVTIQPDTPIQKAIGLMKKLEYGCMPVVHKSHVVGIITIKDVLPYDN